MKLEIRIQNNTTIYEPIVKDGVTLTRKKNGVSTLKFTCINDSVLKLAEGNTVTVISYDLFPYGTGHRVFYGYIFSISPSKNGEISITAYDQIRYLLNKDTYVYSDKKLSELITMICGDCKLKAGSDIMDTGYIIPSRVEDNQTYLDMIVTAIQLTQQNIGTEYILWDNFGEIALCDHDFFKINLRVDESTAQDYSFETSIDSDTFNQVKLHRENEGGVREVFLKSESDTIGQWGLLQYSEKLDKDENGDTKAQEILNQKNRKTRKLSISGALGDIRVRGGSTIVVRLKLDADLGFSIGEYSFDEWMLVENVTHNFSEGIHTMDLDLRGDGIGA